MKMKSLTKGRNSMICLWCSLSSIFHLFILFSFPNRPKALFSFIAIIWRSRKEEGRMSHLYRLHRSCRTYFPNDYSWRTYQYNFLSILYIRCIIGFRRKNTFQKACWAAFAPRNKRLATNQNASAFWLANITA